MESQRFRNLFSFSLAVVDIGLLLLAFIVAYRLRRAVPWPTEAVEMDSLRNYASVMVIFVGAVLVVFFALRLYHLARAASRVDEFYAIFRGVTTGTLLAVAIASLTLKNSVFEVNLPRVMILYFWGFALVFEILGRWLLESIRNSLRERGWTRDNVLIVGTGEAAELVLQKIKGSPFLGYHVLGLVNSDGTPEYLDGLTVMGGFNDLPRLIEDYRVDEVIIALPEMPDDEQVELIGLCQRDRVSVKLFPNIYELITSSVSTDDLGGLPLLSVRDVGLRGWKLTVKRSMDILLSGLGLIVLSPVLLAIAFLVKRNSKGPVLFVQERMGLDGKVFPLLKFRSMRPDSEASGPGWTVKDDPRITPIGRFLRRTSIDELPQLINILLGEMSLVGPRPEQPAYVEKFQKIIPRYMERHREKAGLTGWAQVNGLRGDTSISERTKYDLWYVENWSIWLDIKIIIRTIARVFFDRSAY